MKIEKKTLGDMSYKLEGGGLQRKIVLLIKQFSVRNCNGRY